MKNKYIILVICLIFALSGTYALLKSGEGVVLKSEVEEVADEIALTEALGQELIIATDAEAIKDSDGKGHDELEDYRILVGLVETYINEIKSNKNPEALELMKMVEMKKSDYITLLNSISNIKSRENISKITDLNNLRDDLLELIDQLTMLKE